jgi:cell fate regulator YaaT (PSP1 superfamily)
MMGCLGCTVSSNGAQPAGCKSNGGCSSGGCNRLNTFDWLTSLDIADIDPFEVVEVSFKNGARKAFFRNESHTRATTGDMVVVETGNGYDLGRISLSGELVRFQMKKKKISEEAVLHTVIRKANDRDLERLQEARELEKPTMIRARAIAHTLGLDMKIGDVEFQGDKRKATFFYTADGRVDFRELIRHFAKEFRVKIEMRQIGARQESARIGGIGSCGRELCCSTWLTDFKSVSTSAARYQNLAINQSKLSGQCGRLKCCLNYELDTYLDALEKFPANADKLETEVGTASLVKADIFKGLMFYTYDRDYSKTGKIYTLESDRVKLIQRMNTNGVKPADLLDDQLQTADALSEIDSEEEVTGFIELPEEERRRRKKKKSRGQKGKFQSPPSNRSTSGSSEPKAPSEKKDQGEDKGERSGNKRRGRRKKKK